MTAVVGMLNKNGVAVAADSAVTRSRGDDQKVTKNGNKMVRVSDAVPICVMITGNARFINNPWDIVIRKFRQERGNVLFSTVEASVEDLIDYLSTSESLWNPTNERQWLSSRVKGFMTQLLWNLDSKAQKTDDNGRLKRPRLFVKETLKSLKAAQKCFACANQGFKDYDHDRFKEIINPYLQDYLDNDDNIFNEAQRVAVKENMEEIGQELLTSLYAYLTYTGGPGSATLVFTGYGKDEVFPSLIAIDINEGFDRHINWSMARKVNIDDDTPAAICPFAQTDVINALLSGASGSWLNIVENNMEYLHAPSALLGEDVDIFATDGLSELYVVSDPDISERRRKPIRKVIKENRNSWVKDLVDYDVKSMAELALTLVDLTGLHRILTFQQEGVGGDVDLAVITKNEGFTWLSRKSWYHHKDIGGRYGSMGV